MKNISNILLTGANGFIGQHLLHFLLKKYHVSAITRGNNNLLKENLNWICADLSDPNFISQLPAQIDVVIYLAQSNYYRDFPLFAEDIFQVNIQSLFYLLEWSRKVGVKKFLYTSSANVYHQSDTLINENSLQCPASFYATSKMVAEMLINTYGTYFSTTILRLFTVYGPKQTKALIPTLIDNVRNHQPIKIYGRTGMKLSPIFVSDVCKIIEKSLSIDLKDEASRIFNVCGNEKMDILQLSTLIGSIMNMSPQFEFHACNEFKGWVGDNSKLREHFAELELISLADGLAQTINRQVSSDDTEE